MALAKTDSKTEAEKTASEMVREKAQENARSKESIGIRASMATVRNTTWGKDCSDAQLGALAKIARDLNLDIALDHIIYLGNRPYITHAGHLAHAHNSGKFKGLEDTPLPKEEWEVWGVGEDAKCAWLCKASREGYDMPFIEVGWAGGRREEKQPVARMFPGELARKRAHCRALSLAFPVGVSGYEDAYLGGVEIPEELYEKAKAHAERTARPDPNILSLSEFWREVEAAGGRREEAEDIYADKFGERITSGVTRERADAVLADLRLELEKSGDLFDKGDKAGKAGA